MINDNTLNRVKKLLEDETFASKFFEAENYVDVKTMLLENGIDISNEELKELIESMLVVVENRSTGELNEEEMDKVSGGIIGWIILGGAGAIVGGIAANKLRKVLNSMSGVCG